MLVGTSVKVVRATLLDTVGSFVVRGVGVVRVFVDATVVNVDSVVVGTIVVET